MREGELRRRMAEGEALNTLLFRNYDTVEAGEPVRKAPCSVPQIPA